MENTVTCRLHFIEHCTQCHVAKNTYCSHDWLSQRSSTCLPGMQIVVIGWP